EVPLLARRTRRGLPGSWGTLAFMPCSQTPVESSRPDQEDDVVQGSRGSLAAFASCQCLSPAQGRCLAASRRDGYCLPPKRLHRLPRWPILSGLNPTACPLAVYTTLRAH